MTIKRFWSWLLVFIGLAAAGAYLYQTYNIGTGTVDLGNPFVYVLWSALGIGCGYFLSSGVDMLGDNPRKKK